MGWRASVSALLKFYLAGSVATTAASPAPNTVGEVVWGQTCTGSGIMPGVECGYAIVPLDYFDPSVGVAKVALARLNATSGNRRGSVFINPGGPGGSGVSILTSSGDVLQGAIGEDWDIIGFDPRGIGATEPPTKCFPSPEARTAFLANTVLQRSYDVSPNVTDEANRNHLIELQRDANTLYKTQFAICAQTMGDLLKYAGTSTVVRDIDLLTTLIDGEDALINFYGLSYGTIMGQYLVNMFPDRVGRVVIDGVADAHMWSTVPPFQRLPFYLNSTEDTYKLFYQRCAESGPSLCALASTDNEDPNAIMARVEAFIDDLYIAPLPVPNATLPGILTSGRARLAMMSALEEPDLWSDIAKAIAHAMAGDGFILLVVASQQELVDLERSAVTCNDVKPFAPPTAEEIIDESLFALENVSRFGFAVTTSEPDNGCEYWPVTPPERFEGPFNNTLNNPILIVSNTRDPVTPLLGGQIVHDTMGNNSALLVQDGPGHTSFRVKSTCTIRATRAFFANGTLPAPGTVCPVDYPNPFVPVARNSGSDSNSSSSVAVSAASATAVATSRAVSAMVSAREPDFNSEAFANAHQKLRETLRRRRYPTEAFGRT